MKRATMKAWCAAMYAHVCRLTGADPPLKRHELEMHRMVSAEVVARQRAEIRRLRRVLLKISVGPHGIDQYGHCSYRRAAALALAPKRRARK